MWQPHAALNKENRRFPANSFLRREINMEIITSYKNVYVMFVGESVNR